MLCLPANSDITNLHVNNPNVADGAFITLQTNHVAAGPRFLA